MNIQQTAVAAGDTDAYSSSAGAATKTTQHK